MALPDRLIALPPPGASSMLAGEHPYTALVVDTLAHDARYLARANACRPLAAHPGLRDFYMNAARDGGGSPFADPPAPADIRWSEGAAYGNVRLGTFYVWPEAWKVNPPLLVLRFRVVVAATYTCGVCLVVVPGISSGPLAPSHSVGAAYTSTTYQNATLTIPLTRADLAALDRPILPGDGLTSTDEQGQPYVCSVFVGCYCSSNTNGLGASLVGLTLGLEPQP